MPKQAQFMWDVPGLVAGVDEAGRGPLAGPVVAAAVILDDQHPIAGLADSKKLSERARERLYHQIMGQALCCSIAQGLRKWQAKTGCISIKRRFNSARIRPRGGR